MTHDVARQVRGYLMVFGTLLVLTLVTVGVSYLDLPEFETVIVALVIATTKAALVAMFFMHLKYEADWKYVLTVPASIMSVLLILALVPDVLLRVHKYSEERKMHAAEPQETRGHGAGGHSAAESSPGAHGGADADKGKH